MTELTDRTDDSLEYDDDEAYLTPPTDLQTMLMMDVYHFSHLPLMQPSNLSSNQNLRKINQWSDLVVVQGLWSLPTILSR